MLAFDEWNVWWKTFGKPEHVDGGGAFAPHLVEERYDLADAGGQRGEVSFVDAGAVVDGDRLSLFVTNRSVDTPTRSR
jgi:alpha-L-arabinofuranosidase